MSNAAFLSLLLVRICADAEVLETIVSGKVGCSPGESLSHIAEL